MKKILFLLYILVTVFTNQALSANINSKNIVSQTNICKLIQNDLFTDNKLLKKTLKIKFSEQRNITNNQLKEIKRLVKNYSLNDEQLLHIWRDTNGFRTNINIINEALKNNDYDIFYNLKAKNGINNYKHLEEDYKAYRLLTNNKNFNNIDLKNILDNPRYTFFTINPKYYGGNCKKVSKILNNNKLSSDEQKEIIYWITERRPYYFNEGLEKVLLTLGISVMPIYNVIYLPEIVGDSKTLNKQRKKEDKEIKNKYGY